MKKSLKEVNSDVLKRMLGERSDTAYGKEDQELSAYMQTFKKYPVIRNHKSFQVLYEQWKAGDESAYEKILCGNCLLVLSVALRLSGRGLPLVDMIQEGQIGMMHGLEKYNPALGHAFSTYAMWWIRQAIMRAIDDKGNHAPFRMPIHMLAQMRKVRQAIESFYRKHGYWASDKEIHHWMMQEYSQKNSLSEAITLTKSVITLGQVSQCLQLLERGYFSLDDTLLSVDGQNEKKISSIVQDVRVDVESTVEARKLLTEYERALRNILDVLDSLPARQAGIVRYRYGIGGFPIMTLEELGARYELTKERVRQLAHTAFESIEEILGVTRDDAEGIFEAVHMLREMLNVALASEDEDDNTPPPESSSAETHNRVWRLLCEHIVLTPMGVRIVKAPLATLQSRLNCTRRAAMLTMERFKCAGLIEGSSPWETVRIMPQVAVPDFSYYDSQHRGVSVRQARRYQKRKNKSSDI